MVLLLEEARTGAETQVTTRFPNWGDAADLITVLDVEPDPDDANRFTSAAFSDWRRPVVEGSQMLGQAIVAASRRSPGRRAVSASMMFTRPADARVPYTLELDEVADGRTFSAFGIRVTQAGRTCAAGNVLLDVTAADVIRHGDDLDHDLDPKSAVPYDMSVTGRELRVVDGAYDGAPDAAIGPPELDVWVRFRAVPDDRPIHAALLAQFTGHMSIAAALRPHAGIGQDAAHLTLSTAVNAISLSIHADISADRWMLYRHRSTHAGDGMTHSECRVHDEGGTLIASFTVDCMVRAFTDPSHGDARSAL
jgi:acyl-CoA thioesterase II